MKRQANTHGGARKDAGRPASVEKTEVVSARIPESMAPTLSTLEKLYGGRTVAIQTIIPGFVSIREGTLQEIKGTFTKQELMALLSAQNGTILIPEHQAHGQLLIAAITDYELYENGVTLTGANLPVLVKKIKSLTAAQVFFLQDEIDLFWKKGTDDSSNFLAYSK